MRLARTFPDAERRVLSPPFSGGMLRGEVDLETTAVLEKQAAGGNREAQFRLGYRLAFCRDRGRRSWSRARALWLAAARQGHHRAEFYLATCYDLGKGTRKDRRLAMHWYRLAATGGHAVAAYNLALGFRDGDGVRADPRAAAHWFAFAANQGDPDAQSDYGYCLHEGIGVRKNRGEAVRWYRRAARAGVVKAQLNLGLCYRGGEGVTQSARNAKYWLAKAALGGNAQARTLLVTERSRSHKRRRS